MNDELDAHIMRDAIVSTQKDIESSLRRLANTLELYGFILRDCDTDVTVDRYMNGDVGYRLDVRINVEVK